VNAVGTNNDPEKPQVAEGKTTEVMICVKLVNIVHTHMDTHWLMVIF